MIVNKLNLCTACLAIAHASTGSNTNNQLLIEGTTDCPSRELRYEQSCGPKDAAFGATDILPVDEETRVTLRQFNERLVDRTQHRCLASGSARSILPPLRKIQH